MSSRFYLSSPASTSNSSLSSADPDSLPFPKPLNRESFLQPEFDPATFLSTLTSRFQTLEDLRLELASLSQTIEDELVDLVNHNYSDFLNLGSSLQGGEEKIEEIRVGLLGFERDVKSLREKADGERTRVAELVAQKKQTMREVNVGRSLLDIDRRLRDLEVDLGLKEKVQEEVEIERDDEDDKDPTPWGSEWDDDLVELDDEDYEQEQNDIPSRLNGRIDRYCMIKALIERFGRDHPFIVTEQGRVKRVMETILLDIDAAIRSIPSVKGKQVLLGLRRSIEE